MRATVRRRLVRQLRRVGLQVADLRPGTVVVTRTRARLEAAALGRGLGLVVDSTIARRRPQAPAAFLGSLLGTLPDLGLRVTEIGPAAALVTQEGAKVKTSAVSPGTTLLTEPGVVRRHRHEQDNGLSRYLATQQIMNVLELYRVNVVLDVGANKGQYARSLRRAGYKGHIVSFEPVGREFEELRRRAADDARWSVHQIALGRSDGSIEMNVVPGTLSSALPASDFGSTRYAKLQGAVVETVPVRRLDGILDEVLADVPDPRPYLKLDTQGFDLEAFAGLGDRAADVVGMQSEVAFLRIYEGMPRMPESLAAYEAAGFEVAGCYLVTREKRTARVLELDCVLVRADALPRA